MDDAVARRSGGDDFDGAGKCLVVGTITLKVIVMEVGINNIADGFVGNGLNLLDKGTGGGDFGVGIDDEYAIVEDDDGGIGIDDVGGASQGDVDTVSDFF